MNEKLVPISKTKDYIKVVKMKHVIYLFYLVLIICSCNGFNSEKEAITICQNAKPTIGFFTGSTWLDVANTISKEDPNNKYDWHAKATGENNYYLVEFVDNNGWGQRWEVDVDQKIVKNVNQNPYLSRKYGLRRYAGTSEFEIVNPKQNEMKLVRNFDYLNNDKKQSVVYMIKGSVIHKTANTITDASINGSLNLIFKEKTVSESGNFESGFSTRISKANPWKPNTSRAFYIKTKSIEALYLNYLPEFVMFNVSLKAEDPIGYTFDKDILDVDMKQKWKTLKTESELKDNSSVDVEKPTQESETSSDTLSEED